MPCRPTSCSASLTSSSLKGFTIASIFFTSTSPQCSGPVGRPNARLVPPCQDLIFNSCVKDLVGGEARGAGGSRKAGGDKIGKLTLLEAFVTHPARAGDEKAGRGKLATTGSPSAPRLRRPTTERGTKALTGWAR